MQILRHLTHLITIFVSYNDKTSITLPDGSALPAEFPFEVALAIFD
jgi:hypothetical protein